MGIGRGRREKKQEELHIYTMGMSPLNYHSSVRRKKRETHEALFAFKVSARKEDKFVFVYLGIPWMTKFVNYFSSRFVLLDGTNWSSALAALAFWRHDTNICKIR